MTTLPAPNQQCLDIQSTPRAEMKLFPLDTFAYEFPGSEIKINFEIPEFTAICPFSDFPDFATIRIEYVPNVILEDFIAACDPLSVDITGDFHVRGNIKTVVKASYKKP